MQLSPLIITGVFKSGRGSQRDGSVETTRPTIAAGLREVKSLSRL